MADLATRYVGRAEPEDVHSQLELVLASRGFASSASLARFLRYIVGETLAGRGDGLKEYHLGVEIFDRGEAFDPRIDPIVRVQARNLRIKLEKYYSGPGAGDPVRIDLPKGCYIPAFVLRDEGVGMEPPPAPVPAAVPAAAPAFALPHPPPPRPSRRWALPGWCVAPICLLILLAAGLVFQRQRNGIALARAAGAAASVSVDGGEARGLYLRGRYLLDRQTDDSLRKALACFRQAVAIEPNHAAAWAGIADVYDVMSQFGLLSPQEGMAEARRAAQKSLSIDPNLAEGRLALAAILEAYDWNWKGAEREYKRAIELNPNLAPARAWYGMFLRDQGRLAEAVPQLELAYRLDPLSINTNFNLANVYAMRGDLDSAIRYASVCAELEPLSPKPALMLAGLYRKKKQPEQAREAFEKARLLGAGSPSSLSAIASSFARAGQKEEAGKLLEDLRRMSRERYVSPYSIAMVYMAMRDFDRAMPYLEAAYRERSTGLLFLREAKGWEAYRASRRFRELIGRMRFNG